MSNRLFALVVLAAGWAGPSAAEVRLSFTPMPRQIPISRLEAPMVYDSANQRLVVFGGYDHNFNRYNEVWEYTGASQAWRNVTPTSGARPVPRSGSTMAYDPARQRIVLFGGLNDAQQWLGDTWEWDCNARTWTQVATGGVPGVDKPEPRQGATLVYDTANDRHVLFGGVDMNKFYKDTWAFDPDTRTWALLATGVSSSWSRAMRGRAFHGMTVAANRVFVFAGEGFDCDIPCPVPGPVLVFEDLWELVGTTWTDRTPSDDPAGNSGACANAAACPGKAAWRGFSYDGSANRLVTQGGYASTGNLKTTWAYNLASGTWLKIADNIGGPTSNLGERDSHALAYDSARAVVVLFGGYLADLWELSGSTWTTPPQYDPRFTAVISGYPRQDYHAMAWDSARNRALAVSGGAAETWSLDTTSANPIGWFWPLESVGSITSRLGHAVAYSPVIDRLLMFGGRCEAFGLTQGAGSPCGASGTLYNDLRSFNPATRTWSLLSPSGGPPAVRWDHALVYDPVNNEIVLFGGRDAAGNALGDTWVLSCASASSCTWAAGGGGPAARYGHAMAWDPSTSRVVMFGGQNAGTLLGDVWAWNGGANSWSGVGPAGTAPSARIHAALAQADKVRPGLLLFGGRDAGGPRNDAFLLSGAGGGSPQWQPVTITGASPTPRENAEMVFGPGLNRMVLFGGFDANGLLPGDVHLATVTVKGDMDVSGSTDLMLRSLVTQQTVSWEMDGVNLIGSHGLSATPTVNEQVVGVDDFDADGRNDVAIWNAATSQVSFWLINNWVVASMVPLGNATPLGLDWKIAATADFNHDGRPDLLWRNSTTQKLAVWTLVGTSRLGALVPSPDQAIDPNWEVVGALDYNADGNTDLLWYNPNSGKIVFWFLDYNARRIIGQFANPPNAGDNNWRVLAAGDYGVGPGGFPGTKDIVWRNATSGRYVVWHMDTAGNRTAGVFTNPMSPAPDPTSWTIVGPR